MEPYSSQWCCLLTCCFVGSISLFPVVYQCSTMFPSFTANPLYSTLWLCLFVYIYCTSSW